MICIPREVELRCKATYDIMSDYHPFGMLIEDRQTSNDHYRFGFNGMEEYDDISGEGNTLDFGARIYSSRVARWLSVDPLSSEQPSWTPYKAFLDNPCMFIDLTGKIETIQTIIINKATKTRTINVTHARRLMTDGDIHYVERRWSSDEYQANPYYDFTTTKVVVIDDHGQIVETSVKRTINYKGGVRAYEGVYIGGDDFGDTKYDWWSPSYVGGVAFYSSSGRGEESKVDIGNANLVDIGPLLDAIEAYGPSKSLQKQLNGIRKRVALGKDDEAVMDAMTVVGEWMEFFGDNFDKGYSLKDNLEKSSELQSSSNQQDDDSTVCKYCNETIHKETRRSGDNPKHKHPKQD